MTILALLQCQWFKNPSRAAKILARYQEREGGYWPGRALFNRDMLFLGCLTGRRLKQAFGDLCGQIVWEEVSTQMGDRPGACFPPEPEHVLGALQFHKPAVLLCFGRVADVAIQCHEVVMYLGSNGIRTFLCPHPAARGVDTLSSLRLVAEQLRKELMR